jgi:hypothetical protein
VVLIYAPKLPVKVSTFRAGHHIQGCRPHHLFNACCPRCTLLCRLPFFFFLFNPFLFCNLSKKSHVFHTFNCILPFGGCSPLFNRLNNFALLFPLCISDRIVHPAPVELPGLAATVSDAWSLKISSTVCKPYTIYSSLVLGHRPNLFSLGYIST